MRYIFLMSVIIAATIGADVNISRYYTVLPYQVSIQVMGKWHWHNYCGGSLVKLDWVLTAAHCMNMLPKKYVIKAGTTDLSKPGDVRFIRSYVNHPNYNPDTMDCDISLIRLNKYVPNLPTIKPIKFLPKTPWKIPDNFTATVFGWGKSSSNKLRKLKVRKYNHQQCRRKVHVWNDLTNHMTCFIAAKEGKGTCQGDSGSPAVIDKYVVGIVSWGHSCGQLNLPSVYTDLNNWDIINFLDKHLRFIRSE